MHKSLILLALLAVPAQAHAAFTASGKIANITFEHTDTGEKFIILTLSEAISLQTPDHCEKATGKEFAIDQKSTFAKDLYLPLSAAGFDGSTVTFVISGCAFGYPKVWHLLNVQ